MPTLTVAESRPDGRGLHRLVFDAIAADHTRPGQYALVTVDDLEPAFFAYAQSPGEPVQLLVKDDPGVASHLARARPGRRFDFSATRGEGFPLERVQGLPLVILCNGSALGAVRPVVRAELAAGLPRPVHLLYGVLHPDRRCYAEDRATWARLGVQVHTVVDAAGAAGWEGPVGYVQDHAAQLGLVRPDVGVVLCGVPAMLDAARARYVAAGCPPERVLVNF